MGEPFFRRGVSEIHLLPAVANRAAPTAPEIAAGIDLSEQATAINNWNFQSSRIPAPALKFRFTPQVSGEDTVGNSEIVFNEHKGGDDIRDALPKGLEGFVLFMPEGPGTGLPAEVWHVEVQSSSRNWTTSNERAQFTVAFAVVDPPEQDAVLP